MAFWMIGLLTVALFVTLLRLLVLHLRLSKAQNFINFFGHQPAVDRKLTELAGLVFDADVALQRTPKGTPQRTSRSQEFACHRDIFSDAYRAAIQQGRIVRFTWVDYLTNDQRRILRSLQQQ